MHLFTLLSVMAICLMAEAYDDFLSSYFQAHSSKMPKNDQSRLKSLSNSVTRKRKRPEENYSALSGKNREERLSQEQRKASLGNHAEKGNGVKSIQSGSSLKVGRARVKGETNLNKASVTTPGSFETKDPVEHVGTVPEAVTDQTTKSSHDVASVMLNDTSWNEIVNGTNTKEQNLKVHLNRTFVLIFMVGVMIFLLLITVLIIIGLTCENFARNKNIEFRPDWERTVTEPSGGEKEPEPPCMVD